MICSSGRCGCTARRFFCNRKNPNAPRVFPGRRPMQASAESEKTEEAPASADPGTSPSFDETVFLFCLLLGPYPRISFSQSSIVVSFLTLSFLSGRISPRDSIRSDPTVRGTVGPFFRASPRFAGAPLGIRRAGGNFCFAKTKRFDARPSPCGQPGLMRKEYEKSMRHVLDKHNRAYGGGVLWMC